MTGPAANTTVGEVAIIIPKIQKHLATSKSPIFDFDMFFLIGDSPIAFFKVFQDGCM